jgi:FAD-dependent sensor of blue light
MSGLPETCAGGAAMILIRLTYFSRNHLDLFNGPMEERVAELLAVSTANNRRDDITGALIWDSKWFAQILEGHEGVVSRAFERILRDQRHAEVALVAMQPISERTFASCPMVAIAHGEHNRDVFRHFGERGRFDPLLMRPDRLADLIEALVERDRMPVSAAVAR